MKKPEIGIKPNLNKIGIFRLDNYNENAIESDSLDFYKITLIKGGNVIHYAGKSIQLPGAALMFLSPNVPCIIENPTGNKTGFLCVFSKTFFPESVQNRFHTLPLYEESGRFYSVNENQVEQITSIFARMLLEMDSKYVYKYDLIRNYISELTHIALKSLSEKDKL